MGFWNDFSFWFVFGCRHIININAWDHLSILMLLVLNTQKIQTILLQISAFTIGHALSLTAFLILKFKIPSCLIEWLIGMTLVGYSFTIVFKIKCLKTYKYHYILIIGFGLCHGLGFIQPIQLLLSSQSLWSTILGFNFGVELAQLVVSCLFFLFYLLLYTLCNHRVYTILGYSISLSIGIFALLVSLQRLFVCF